MKDHYDLTAGKRKQAVAAGAVIVDLDQAVELWAAKRVKVEVGDFEHLFGSWSPNKQYRAEREASA